MREYIKQVLVAAAEAAVERGENLEGRHLHTRIFGDKEAEVIRYCQENPGILTIQTVGSGPFKLSIFMIDDDYIKFERLLPFAKNEDNFNKKCIYRGLLRTQPDREDIKELLKELEQ